MQCPKCGAEMRTILYEGVQIDKCSSCEGEWLDGGELKTIVKRREEKFSPEEVESVRSSINETREAPEKMPEHPYHCPRCGVDLVRINYALSSGVWIDRCENCGGVWLDKNELEQIQFLAEEGEKKLAEDTNKYGNGLARIREESEGKEEEETAGKDVSSESSRMLSAFRRTLFPFIFHRY